MQHGGPTTPRRTRRRGRASAVLAGCLVLGVSLQTAAADPTPDPAGEKSRVDDQLADSRALLDETSDKLVDAYDALSSTRAKLPAARDAATKAADAEEVAQGEYDDASAALDVAQADERKAEKDLKKTSARITRTRDTVGGFAGQVYQQQGLGDLTVAVGADTPGEVVDRIVLAESAGGARGDALDELSSSRADLVATGDELEALRKKTKDAKDAKSGALDRARSASDEADKAKRALDALERRQTSQASTLRRERAKEQGRVDRLEAQSDKLSRILQERARRAKVREAKIREARADEERRRRETEARAKASQPSSGPSSSGTDTSPDVPTSNPNPPAPSSSGVLAAPITAPVTSEFGYRFHPIYQVWRLHAGRDYGAACGTPVYAAADGEVVSALPPGSTGGYGNQVVLDHGVQRGISLATTYNHLERYVVTSGRVTRGQVIGYEGTTGSSTGCHLHFETWENGTAVDPRGWL